MALNDRQELFCQHYAIEPNATQAAIKAGYSTKTAYSHGQRLLKNDEIVARIAEFTEEAGKAREVTAERVIDELARLGFGRFTDIASVSEHGVHFIDSEDWTPDADATVKSAKSIRTVTRDKETGEEMVRVTREITQHDKVRSLELLGKRFGIFIDKTEHSTGEDGFTVRLKGLPDKPRGG